MKPIDQSLERLQILQSLERLQILCEAFSKAFAARVSIMHRPGPEAEGIEFALDDIQSRVRSQLREELGNDQAGDDQQAWLYKTAVWRLIDWLERCERLGPNPVFEPGEAAVFAKIKAHYGPADDPGGDGELTVEDIQGEIRTLCALGPGTFQVKTDGTFHRMDHDPGLLETMPAGDYHVDEEGQITPIEPSARDEVIASMGLDFVEQMEVGLKRARIEDAADLVRQLTAQCAILGAALAPFARIHERRSEGNERSASVSQSPAACSVQDCQAAWLALNPANPVRDADPDLGDVDPGQ